MAENIEVENSYYKGANFEILFAEFMKSDLGWGKYVIRSQQKGKRNSRGSQVDIIGERQDPMGKKLQTLSMLYGLFMAVVVGIGLLMDSWEIIIIGFVLGLGGIVFAVISRDRHKEHSWVECKNRKDKSNYNDIRKSIDEYDDYKKSGDNEYKYVVHYFVSANGFTVDALEHADKNKIVCYSNKNGVFEIEKFWK